MQQGRRWLKVGAGFQPTFFSGVTMTPAIDLLKKARAASRVLSYSHDPKAPSYGLEAAEKLGLDPQRVFKTLLAATGRASCWWRWCR